MDLDLQFTWEPTVVSAYIRLSDRYFQSFLLLKRVVYNDIFLNCFYNIRRQIPSVHSVHEVTREIFVYQLRKLLQSMVI